jgi:putative SOS response-associated peptidase YedK
LQLTSFETKKRGWTIQHRPTSNPSKALPDSPGRAARKPAGKKIQFSGTERLLLPVDSWREWLRETSSRACFSFVDPQNKIAVSSASTKPAAAELAYKLIVGHFD